MRVDFIIDGAAVGAASGATFTRRDPVTGAVASEAAAASEADVARAVEAAHRAFPAWSETGPSERRALLLKAADLLEAHTADFAQAMTEEIGATGPWGGFNVHFAASLLREAAALTTQITGAFHGAMPSTTPAGWRTASDSTLGLSAGMISPVICVASAADHRRDHSRRQAQRAVARGAPACGSRARHGAVERPGDLRRQRRRLAQEACGEMHVEAAPRAGRA